MFQKIILHLLKTKQSSLELTEASLFSQLIRKLAALRKKDQNCPVGYELSLHHIKNISFKQIDKKLTFSFKLPHIVNVSDSNQY